MLAAPNKAAPLHGSAPSDPFPTLDGFGNVVKSLEGLQQRLEDLSIAEITQAQSTAQSLVTGLADLERKLAHVASINCAVVAARKAVDGIQGEWALPDLAAAPELYLRTSGAGHTSKILVFPRLNRPTDTTAGANASAPAEIIAAAPFEPLGDAATAQGDARSRQEVKPQDHDAVYFIPAAALDTPLGHGEPQFVDEPFTSVAPEFEAPRLQDGGEPPTGAVEDEMAEKQQSADCRAEFDQRLLDELIENYGEFVAPFDRTSAPPAREETSAAVLPKPIPAAEASDTVPVDAQSAPDNNKQGDIDRQLKNLIKDYGQYDIYSPQRRVSLKTALIGASLLIGLLASGFYYFSSESPHSPGSSGQIQPAYGVSPAGGNSVSGTAALLAPNNGKADSR